jgi:hypothetical protein
MSRKSYEGLPGKRGKDKQSLSYNPPPDPWWMRPVPGWPRYIDMRDARTDAIVRIYLRGSYGQTY